MKHRLLLVWTCFHNPASCKLNISSADAFLGFDANSNSALAKLAAMHTTLQAISDSEGTVQIPVLYDRP